MGDRRAQGEYEPAGEADANRRKILGQAARIGELSELDFETTTSFEAPISNDTRHRARY